MMRCQLAAVLMLVLVGCGDNEVKDGEDGADGYDSLVSTTAEPAGANCATGGTRIDIGLDSNRSGTLDANEITSTSYVCGTTSHESLVRTTSEPPGANCPIGGTKLETGVDENDNNVLEDTEVNAATTAYVCSFAPSGALATSTGIALAYKPGAVTTNGGAISVRFTIKDDRGYPLDIKGVYSANTPIQPRFSLSYAAKNATTGVVAPLSVYTKTTSNSAPAGLPTMYNPTNPTQGTLVENGLGAGDYTYTFPTTSTTNGAVAVAYDATKLDETHVVWIQATRQTDLVFTVNANTFSAANEPYYYIPSGMGTPTARDIVAQGKCDNCHAKFKAETTASAAFHGGGRVAASMCNVCHNPGRTTNLLADSASFVHRIHQGHVVAPANQFHGIAATYPQDTRNCDTCHGGASQGAQAMTNPSKAACNGCHDYVQYTGNAPYCGIGGTLVRDVDGRPVPCKHIANDQLDSDCVTCHGPGETFATTRYHKPVASPDPDNAWLGIGANNNTHASFVAAGGYVPPGADVITYDLKSVETFDDNGIKRPRMTFKLKRNGTDVVFQDTSIATELMPDFVGSPSAYFAWAVPQDNLSTPADFNASASGYIKKIWDGTAVGTGAGMLGGPDLQGYYTLTLTGVRVPTGATLLTGGLGYTYSLSSTPPLVQTNIPEYPWVAEVPANGQAQGGLSVPAPNVWKVATGFTGRRAIVDNAKCNKCHGALGVTPSFHAGQRNDGPTCSFCHTPNRSSAGWAAGSKYFIHAIHAGRKRSVPYTWHAAAVGEGYDEIEFPGTLNTCTTCHVAGTYDFTNSTSFAAIPNMAVTTVATGTLDPNPLTNSRYYTVSPYVALDGVTNYGAPFSYNPGTDVTTPAAGTTLVISPITAACSACHDSSQALAHMRLNGGSFYEARSDVLATSAPVEQCMVCHGPGRSAAIGVVHQR